MRRERTIFRPLAGIVFGSVAVVFCWLVVLAAVWDCFGGRGSIKQTLYLNWQIWLKQFDDIIDNY